MENLSKPKSTHIWLHFRDSKPSEIDGKVLPLSHDSFNFFGIVNLKQLVLVRSQPA